MALNLANYEKQTREAVKAFWGNRAAAKEKQTALGKSDQGERAGVTSGKNMDGFAALILDLVRKNGLKDAQIHQNVFEALRRTLSALDTGAALQHCRGPYVEARCGEDW